MYRDIRDKHTSPPEHVRCPCCGARAATSHDGSGSRKRHPLLSMHSTQGDGKCTENICYTIYPKIIVNMFIHIYDGICTHMHTYVQACVQHSTPPRGPSVRGSRRRTTTTTKWSSCCQERREDPPLWSKKPTPPTNPQNYGKYVL